MESIARKPQYFFAVFGALETNKLPVESGCYTHKPGYIRNSGIAAGDVVILYCTGTYPSYNRKAPGIGIVLNTNINNATENFYYQYFPFNNPLDWHTIENSIPELENRSNFSLIGNWLRKVSTSSFKNATKNTHINWP